MKRLVLAVFLMLVLACATYPPPKIEKGCYQNYEYGFMLDLPGSDWELLEGTRRHLRKGLPLEIRRNFLLLAYNKETLFLIKVG